MEEVGQVVFAKRAETDRIAEKEYGSQTKKKKMQNVSCGRKKQKRLNRHTYIGIEEEMYGWEKEEMEREKRKEMKG